MDRVPPSLRRAFRSVLAAHAADIPERAALCFDRTANASRAAYQRALADQERAKAGLAISNHPDWL